MSKGTSNSLVDLGNLSKPADSLVKKVSKGVGGIFAPFQIKRVAKAEAEASITKAQSEIEITDLHRRAGYRFIEEEARHQQNMEDITAKALPHLEEDADPDSMEDDWIANFFDKCRIVSDAEMQTLWSRVLAGEANIAGTYSKRTVNFMSDLDKTDANLFSKLCGFAWIIGDIVPLVFNDRSFDKMPEIYTRHGIDFGSLSHLENIGLIQFSSLSQFGKSGFPKYLTVSYYKRRLLLEMRGDDDNHLLVGNALLTKIGQELAPICGSKPVDGFYEHIKDRWKRYLPKTE